VANGNNKYSSDMKKQIETILDEGRYNGLSTHIIAEQLLDLFSVSQQRELLEGFRDFVNKNPNSQHIYNYDVSDYLKTL